MFYQKNKRPEECENIPYAYEEEIEDLLEKNIEVWNVMLS